MPCGWRRTCCTGTRAHTERLRDICCRHVEGLRPVEEEVHGTDGVRDTARPRCRIAPEQGRGLLASEVRRGFAQQHPILFVKVIVRYAVQVMDDSIPRRPHRDGNGINGLLRRGDKMFGHGEAPFTTRLSSRTPVAGSTQPRSISDRRCCGATHARAAGGAASRSARRASKEARDGEKGLQRGSRRQDRTEATEFT